MTMPKLELKCQNPECREIFYRYPSQADRARYCSRRCGGIMRSQGFAAERAAITEQGTKRCRYCNEVKPLEEFHALRLYQCTKCRGEKMQEYRVRNTERLRDYDRARNARRREERKRYNRQYRLRNRERLNAYDRERSKAQPDRQWRLTNPCAYAASRQQYRGRTKVRRNARRRANHKRNPFRARASRARRRALLYNSVGSFSPNDAIRLWHFQRGECALCDVRFGKRPSEGGYHVDHIMPLSRGGSNWPRNLQLLCPQCNCSKKDKTPAEYTLYLRKIGVS